ncbi:MAG: hypothetical protein ACJA1A_000421 [Saprospiraceae bacterium]|jgi:hypothetical protein
MKTNTYILIITLSFISFFSKAQPTYYPTSNITDVVIYERGAMVTKSIDINEETEAGIIIIDSLPKDINPKSLQVNNSDGIKIISVKYDIKQEKSELPSEYESIQLEVNRLKDSIQYFNTITSSIAHEINVIEYNKNFETDQGVNIDQIAKASELYKTKLRPLKIEQYDLQIDIRRLNKKIRALNVELIEQNIKTFNNHRAIIKIEKPTIGDRSITLSYFTPSATWYSFYDLRVNSDETKSVLDHKAYVSQSTGEEWSEVKLTLSNRNPQKRITPPTMDPYRLQNTQHRKHGQYSNQDNAVSGIIRGIVRNVYGETLVGANVLMKGTTNGTITDIDGSFQLSTQNRSKIVVAYTGYETQEIDIIGLSTASITLCEGQTLDEVVVTGSRSYSGYNDQIEYAIRTKPAPKRKSISIKEQQSLNISSFEILRPYTIPSSGEEYYVLLKTSKIPFEFNYLIFPSKEPIAYLNVGIPEWKDYNLFSGNVNLFLSGQYTGVSKIDIAESSDTLWVSLGEDLGVNVERNPVKDYNKKSFFKNKTIELHTFDIEIKNNKNKSINMIVMDQVPISTDEDIKVKILEISDADYVEDSGFLKWKENLKTSENKKYRISYEIKYGKHISVINH